MRFACLGLLLVVTAALAQVKNEEKFLDPINVNVPHISTDKSVQYDYDIVYVRALRAGDKIHKRFFTDFSSPVTLDATNPSSTGKEPAVPPARFFSADWTSATVCGKLRSDVASAHAGAQTKIAANATRPNLTVTAPTRCDESIRADHLRFRFRTSTEWQ